MFHRFTSRSLVLFAAWLASGEFQPAHAQADKEDKKPRLRMVCVSSPTEEQELVLASRDDEGKWLELGTVKLRPSFITEWLPARAGELHLALRDGESLRSVCRFTYPSDSRRALAMLFYDPAKKNYQANVINPGRLNFVKGSALVANYSSLPGAMALGSAKTVIKPGESKVIKPVPEANGMYRLLAAYTGENKELVPCYDRYVASNGDSRDMIFLLPDPTLGLKVFSLSEFGPFD